MFEQMTAIQLFAWAGYLLCIGYLVNRLPIKQLLTQGRIQHLVFGSAACVFGLWLFKTGVHPGLDVHFLWLCALCLMLGLRWALVSASIALFGLTLLGKESWSMLGVNGLIGVVIPLVCTYLIYSFSFHRLPKHFMIYVFICAFLPGALTIAIKMFLLGGYYYLDGIYPWETIQSNYIVLIQLLAFPEAMFNGMTIILLVIYKPHWVYTFYDKFYIENK